MVLIERLYGFLYSQILSLSKKLNIPIKTKNRPKNLKYKPRKPKYTKKEMIRLQKKFFTNRAMAKYLGISKSSVYNYRHAVGLAPMLKASSLKKCIDCKYHIVKSEYNPIKHYCNKFNNYVTKGNFTAIHSMLMEVKSPIKYIPAYAG
jgi:hypothetical protein